MVSPLCNPLKSASRDSRLILTLTQILTLTFHASKYRNQELEDVTKAKALLEQKLIDLERKLQQEVETNTG